MTSFGRFEPYSIDVVTMNGTSSACRDDNRRAFARRRNASRRGHILGSTCHPDALFMHQTPRTMSAASQQDAGYGRPRLCLDRALVFLHHARQ